MEAKLIPPLPVSPKAKLRAATTAWIVVALILLAGDRYKDFFMFLSMTSLYLLFTGGRKIYRVGWKRLRGFLKSRL